MVLSLGIGVALGLLGGGGSILTLPILVYVLGLEPKSAIATSLLVVGTTSVAAAIPHASARRVDLRVSLAFAASSMVGAFAAGRVARSLPDAWLLGGFAATMLVTGLAMLRGRRAEGELVGRRNWPKIALVGLAIGAVTGLIGAGGGFLVVPALVLLCGLPMRTAIGSSLLVIAANSFAGFAGQASAHVPVDLKIAALVTSTAVAGSIGGALLVGRARPAALRRAFAWLVLAMATLMIAREVSTALRTTLRETARFSTIG
jgi:uncharacterized membrane protein YfcA